MKARDILFALLLGLVMYLTWSTIEQKQLLKTMAESLILQSQLQLLKGSPCLDGGSDARTLEAKR